MRPYSANVHLAYRTDSSHRGCAAGCTGCATGRTGCEYATLCWVMQPRWGRGDVVRLKHRVREYATLCCAMQPLRGRGKRSTTIPQGARVRDPVLEDATPSG